LAISFFTGNGTASSLNKKGISAPLKVDFCKIDNIKDSDGIIKEAAYLHMGLAQHRVVLAM